jgi:hypothetical protein
LTGSGDRYIAPRLMREARVALAAGLTLTAIAIGVVLSRSPPAVTRSTPMTAAVGFGTSPVGARICQSGEVLPRGTTAIRVWLEAVIGPPVSVEASAGSRLLTRGARGPGWTTGSITIPVRTVTRTVSRVTVCVNVSQPREPIGVHGVRTATAVAAFDRQGPLPRTAHASAPQYREGPLPGRMVIEYLRPGERSWWSLATSVARRMGLGRAASGTWIAVLAIVLMLALAVVMSRTILGESA